MKRVVKERDLDELLSAHSKFIRADIDYARCGGSMDRRTYEKARDEFETLQEQFINNYVERDT